MIKLDHNRSCHWVYIAQVLLCFIDPRVRKIRNEAFSCPGIFSRTLCFYYVASSPGSPLPHLLDGHRKLVGCSAIPARSCPGPVRYHWGSIVELEVLYLRETLTVKLCCLEGLAILVSSSGYFSRT